MSKGYSTRHSWVVLLTGNSDFMGKIGGNEKMFGVLT